jgi:very-short-patch-repair endonuclease
MPDASELQRLSGLYEQLRRKLLDLSLKNRMLNYALGARSKRHLQIVDEVLDEIYTKLVEEDSSLKILPLDDPGDIPPEEKTEDFIAALQQAKVSDIEYLTKLQALEATGHDDEIALSKLDRELREFVRANFGLPPRPKKNEINRATHARSLGVEPGFELPPKAGKESHTDGSLQTLKFPDELESVMDKIADTARLAEQEMGLSTLFLAFGFLGWYDSPSSDRKVFAPVLLLPVRLERAKSKGKRIYYLSAREGSAELNLSLQKRLEELGCLLPEFETGEEDTACSVEDYLQQVKSAISGSAVEGWQRWDVHRWLVLGHFAFGRSAMYADLHAENWKTHPVAHDLVSAILSGVERNSDDSGALPTFHDDYKLDDPEIEKIAPWLIHDADASQHSALIDVMRNKNLVIQGPPGTGKSQTITNIIANAMETGKRVLFLSEKQAALDVVKRRLGIAGLGDFCLELHSDKSSPKTVIEDLQQRVNIGSRENRSSVRPVDNVWQNNRKKLADYLHHLHDEFADGETAFKLIWRAIRGRSQLGNVVNEFKAATLPDRVLEQLEARDTLESELVIFVEASKAFEDDHGHSAAESAWGYLDIDAIEARDVTSLLEKLFDLRNSSAKMAEFATSWSDSDASSLSSITALMRADDELGLPQASAMVPVVVPEKLDDIENALALISGWHRNNLLLSEQPALSQLGTSQLEIASSLLRRGLSSELAAMTPADLYDHARTQIALGMAILKVIQEFKPILTLFGLDSRVPSGTFVPLVVAVHVGAAVPAEHRAWVNGFTPIDPTKFPEIERYWSAIRANESGWRKYCSGYDPSPWPESEEIERHASILTKSGIKKAWATMHGDLRTARGFAAGLSLAESPDAPGILVKLAQHVRSVRALDENEVAIGVFGSEWRGLATPVDKIGAGLKIREMFKDKVGGLPYGAQVAERLCRFTPVHFERLVGNPDLVPVVSFTKLSNTVRKELDQRSVKELAEVWTREVALMEKVLATDAAKSLATVKSSIADIAKFAKIRGERDEAKRLIDNCPAGSVALCIGPDPKSVEAALAAVTWVRAVRHAGIEENLRDRLLSADCREVRLRLQAAALSVKPACEKFATTLRDLRAILGPEALNCGRPAELVQALDSILGARAELRDLLSIRRCRSGLADAGLGDFLVRAEGLRIAPAQLPALLRAVITERRATCAFAKPALASSSGTVLEALRRQFAVRDREKIGKDRIHIRTALLNNRPLSGSNRGSRKTWTEMALLQNEFSKEKRFTPVRSLLTRAGRSIQALKPCFMMSPLSLAKFVPAGLLEFDLLVIDEASQMRPEDALGSLLRSKQIVVVGDQKQLPPTDFFTRVGETADDDEFEDLDDESILESCQKTFREVRRLKWHYRSRCESLIRFSNENFYRDNPLITFPAAKPGSFSIDLIRVAGNYQFRRNVAEAAVVVQKAVEIMRGYAHLDSEDIPTVGIVSLNVDQRDLLQEELNRVSAGDLLVEEYQEKVVKKGEPVFVKNLENVQGDERDVILISLTYGCQPGATAMAQRFGPINGKQGHRRLNVLFTRARIRIGLFSSFSSADVVPTETSAEGVRILKRYLEYAEGKGQVASSSGEDFDSDFEVEVAERLSAKGYQVETQVGVSGYRIDIGVRQPDSPQRFLAGVECDGARYHSSKSARDRDRLREEILRGMGWEIIRVWSTDWFQDPARETEKLVKKLQELCSRAHEGGDELLPLAEILSSDGKASGHPEIVAERLVQDISNSTAGNSTAVGPDQSAFEPSCVSERLPVASSARDERPIFDQLVEFRETVVRPNMPNWEPHRSILREAMIETFISQNLTDPDDWFHKVPMYLRQGTNPLEKNHYLEQICAFIERLQSEQAPKSEQSVLGFILTSPEDSTNSTQRKLPLTLRSAAMDVDEASGGRPYVTTDLSSNGLQPDGARFCDASYSPILREMVTSVITTEAPIYEDILVERIARAHGFQRSGSNIYQAVSRKIGREHAKTDEGGRTVIWANGVSANKPVPYRGGRADRSHLDVPIAELASLALPYVRLRMSEEEMVRKLAEFFDLGRVRESARSRFEAAIKMAQHTQS